MAKQEQTKGGYNVEIKTCTCTHSYQDEVYGKNRRVCNPIGKDAKGTSEGSHKCTVCGKKHKK